MLMDEEMSTNVDIAPNSSEDAAARATALANKAIDIMNCGLIITLPEPAQRSRSYRDLILQEMNWMASDYYHERRWKAHVGKQICIGIKASIVDRKRLNKNWVANECNVNMKRFWAGIVSNIDSTPISGELVDYCKHIGSKYHSHIHTDTSGMENDYYIGERDLIAVTVPETWAQSSTAAASPDALAAKAHIQKNDVLEMTLLSMQSMGADLYSPLFRPPDDDLDMFTMPLMDPIRDDDFNALLVQNFCLKYSDNTPGLSQMKPLSDSRSVPAITRKFHRQDNEPCCLAMSVRDFDFHVKPKMLFQGELVQTKLSAIDFELLDAWMFDDAPSWPMLAVCLSYRSSASGLHRFEFSAEYCRDVFKSFNRQPRGLVNSSRRLLGPRQRNAITTFLDAPPPKERFRPALDYTAISMIIDDDLGSQLVQQSRRKQPKRGTINEDRNLKNVKKTKHKGGIRERILLLKRMVKVNTHDRIAKRPGGRHSMGNSTKNATAATNKRREVAPDTSNASNGVQTDLKVHLPFSDEPLTNLGGLPVTLLQRKEKSNIIGIIKQTLSGQKTTMLHEILLNEAKGEVIAIPENALVEAVLACGARVMRKSYKSDSKTDPMLHMPNMPYGEYSNRMSKQLRVGFLGIPAKMFAHSLFYSGRFCKNNRVRRVAIAIANAGKIVMPQPNILYARLFENDAVGIFGRFRHANCQKGPEYAQDQHGEQLLKKYTAEVMANSPSKTPNTQPSTDLEVVDILAGYVGLKLSRRDAKQQGALLTDKISLKEIEQIVSNIQPPQVQAQQPTVQVPTAATATAPATAVPPQSTVQGNLAPPAIQGTTVQQPNASVVHQSKAASPIPMQPIAVATMQTSPMQHMQMNPGQMASNSMTRLPTQQGQVMHGPIQHGQITSGSITPKQLPHGQLTPGSVTPNQMPQVKMPPVSMQSAQMGSVPVQSGQIPPGSMAGMPPSSMPQQQMPGNVTQIQMQMEQMKRHSPMDMVGKRRPMMPYEPMYHQQVPMHQQYRYRPMPDMSMMRVPMYPMAMYNKQIPYPKAHEDQYRSQHMQR